MLTATDWWDESDLCIGRQGGVGCTELMVDGDSHVRQDLAQFGVLFLDDAQQCRDGSFAVGQLEREVVLPDAFAQGRK
ncbi:MAG: hypothetical protein AAF581_04260 [Planctomycetota bacterium]